MRTIAIAAFLGSTAMTGGALMLLWGFALQQTLALVIAGPPLMVLSGGIALGTPARETLDDRMLENRTHQRLSRPQPRRWARDLAHPLRQNGHSRTWPRTARRARR